MFDPNHKVRNWLHDHQVVAVGIGVLAILLLTSFLVMK